MPTNTALFGFLVLHIAVIEGDLAAAIALAGVKRDVGLVHQILRAGGILRGAGNAHGNALKAARLFIVAQKRDQLVSKVAGVRAGVVRAHGGVSRHRTGLARGCVR